MSLRNPASDLVDFLDTKTAGTLLLAKASNLFVGPMRPTDESPSPSVWVQNTGGPTPLPYLGGNREAFQRPTVQVMVRGPTDDTAAGEAIARGVYELLQLATVTGYIAQGVVARAAGPEPLGPDRALHDLFSMNFECWYKASMP